LAPTGTHGTRGPGFADSFDTYANGSNIYGQGGWEAWPGGADAFIDNTLASSAPNSLRDHALATWSIASISPAAAGCCGS
jgi:hypothetical protein